MTTPHEAKSENASNARSLAFVSWYAAGGTPREKFDYAIDVYEEVKAQEHMEMSEAMLRFEIKHPPTPPAYDDPTQREAWVTLWQCGIRDVDQLDAASAKVVEMVEAAPSGWTGLLHEARIEGEVA